MRTLTWTGRSPPTRIDFAVLDDAQQTHLRGRGELADFVEEQRAAVSLLEPSLAPGDARP